MANEQPAMTTDGRRPSWMFKQVDRLVAASEAEAGSCLLAPDLGAVQLAPHRSGQHEGVYKRVNGPITLGDGRRTP